MQKHSLCTGKKASLKCSLNPYKWTSDTWQQYRFLHDFPFCSSLMVFGLMTYYTETRLLLMALGLMKYFFIYIEATQYTSYFLESPSNAHWNGCKWTSDTWWQYLLLQMTSCVSTISYTTNVDMANVQKQSPKQMCFCIKLLELKSSWLFFVFWYFLLKQYACMQAYCSVQT